MHRRLCFMLMRDNFEILHIHIITSVKEGIFFIGVSLFVSRIRQNLLNRFSQNSVERWHMGH